MNYFRRNADTTYDFDNMKALSAAFIAPRASKLRIKFDHPQPALLGEWYKLDILITNDEKSAVENLILNISLPDDNDRCGKHITILFTTALCTIFS